MITVCGPKVTLSALRKIKPETPPNAGKRWQPIQHGELVDAIKDEVTTRGWKVTQELFSTARDGADMAGAILIEGVQDLPTIPGMSLALGFLNSNARRKALQITVGASIACCTNGLCTGTILLNRVHDRTVDLPSELEGAVNRYKEAAAGIPTIVKRLRERELAPAEASEVLMQTGRLGLIGWAAIGRVDREYRSPRFAEHGKNTSWALLNAFTYAARPNIAATRQMEVYDAFRQLLPVADLN